jgi:4,5-DOPA dioxygenase extradiol
MIGEAILPTLFISHGPPDLLVTDCPSQKFLQMLGKKMPAPSGIIVVSAHWQCDQLTISNNEWPRTVYDFGPGFNEALYRMDYPAHGSSEIVDEIQDCLNRQSIDSQIVHDQGLDHGAWIPLKLMYPKADIPIVQISLMKEESATTHWRTGRALASLRLKNYLLIGSGSITHNLKDAMESFTTKEAIATPDYATTFCQWLDRQVQTRRIEQLLDWLNMAPESRRVHPTDEHFLPFFFALGAAGPDWQGKLEHQSFLYSTIGMGAYSFSSS